MIPLTSKRRSELRADAHKLSPVVLIGDKGLTDAVILETDRALAAHALIKVRAMSDDREARSAWMATLCERLGAHPVQEIGKVFVLYREKPPEKKPAPKAEKKVGKKPRSPRTLERSPKAKTKTKSGSLWTKKKTAPRGTSRPRSPAPSPRPASGPLRRRPRTSR